jgi:GT2 family glycosyltransferase
MPAVTHWPAVSVVIPTWNGLSLLSTYLPSVRRALENYPGPWECLIIDDGGTDATAQELPPLFPQARYVRRECNAGFAAAANTGFEAAQHELMLLLNNDIRVERDFLLPLAEHFCNLPPTPQNDLFAVVSLQINPATDDQVNPALEGCRELRFKGGELRLPVTIQSAHGECARPTALANGGCSLFSRTKVRALGGFCPLFNPFYYEDAELSMQALRRGWRMVFEPRSVVEHRPNSTTARHTLKISSVTSRNMFFFHWLVLDGVWQWSSHVACIFVRLFVRSLRGEFEYARGLLSAMCCLPEVRKRRSICGRNVIFKSLQEICRGNWT